MVAEKIMEGGGCGEREWPVSKLLGCALDGWDGGWLMVGVVEKVEAEGWWCGSGW